MSNNRLVSFERKVAELRLRRGISSVDKQAKAELSCFSYPGGEIAHLVERQLLTTEFGYGSWKELRNSEILSAVNDYIEKELKP